MVEEEVYHLVAQIVLTTPEAEFLTVCGQSFTGSLSTCNLLAWKLCEVTCEDCIAAMHLKMLADYV